MFRPPPIFFGLSAVRFVGPISTHISASAEIRSPIHGYGSTMLNNGEKQRGRTSYIIRNVISRLTLANSALQ